MKVVLLAGGFGSRLSEYTDLIPKPMVRIGGRPILWHIMNRYAQYNHKDFYLALGYKAEVVKEYFVNFGALNSDLTIDFASGAMTNHSTTALDWRVTMVDTGLNSMTGGRVKRLQSFIGNEPFLLTYGDGLSDVNIAELVEFHKSHGKMVTVSAVHPAARFGELELDGDNVTSFKEKPQTGQAWINGGFFVVEPEFFEFLDGDDAVLEQKPLEKIAEMGELVAYRHDGFWQCMDTKRDHDTLESLWQSGDAPWRF